MKKQIIKHWIPIVITILFIIYGIFNSAQYAKIVSRIKVLDDSIKGQRCVINYIQSKEDSTAKENYRLNIIITVNERIMGSLSEEHQANLNIVYRETDTITN